MGMKCKAKQCKAREEVRAGVKQSDDIDAK